MTADKSAALPVEREKFEAAMQPIFPLWTFQSDGVGGYHNHATEAARIAWETRAASAPIPAGQEVRMLTVDEIRCAHPDYMLHDRRGLFIAVIRKFCEVSGLKLAPATTEPKP